MTNDEIAPIRLRVNAKVGIAGYYSRKFGIGREIVRDEQMRREKFQFQKRKRMLPERRQIFAGRLHFDGTQAGMPAKRQTRMPALRWRKVCALVTKPDPTMAKL
jgi:hypothetical protein